MKSLVWCVCVLAFAAAPVLCDDAIFTDDFEDGILDGWLISGVGNSGYSFWELNGEMWGRASDGADCSYCPNCHAFAFLDGVTVTDCVLEVTITDRNSCGWLLSRSGLRDLEAK